MQSHYPPPLPIYPPSEEQAISIALAQSLADQAAWAASGSQASTHQSVLKRSVGEALSKQLWRDGSLDYGDVITDGFYDIYGDFPEVCEGPHEFPSLENLRKVRTGSGDVREVVLVDHELDQGLLQVEEMLSEAMAEANPQDVAARIRVVAHVVADRFGGTYDSEAALERFWLASSAAEKRRNRSAVLLLCRLDVGSLRHRALLFKVLADAVKVQCKLIRGQALCGCESAANVMVRVDGGEHVVDLVFEPGRLLNQDQFAALVHARKMRLDSWHNQQHPLQVSISANLGSGVETSAVSASSTSSAGTPAATTATLSALATSASGSTMPAAAFSSSGAGSGASGAPQSSANGGSGSAGGTLATSISVAVPEPPPPPPAHSSPRAALSRPHVLVPPVPAPGTYSSSLPAPGSALHGQGGAAWGLGPGYVHGNGPGPAIAGSRVRFTITDLPKTGSVQPQGARAESRPPPPPPPLPGSGTGASAPVPLPAPPNSAAVAASGRGSGDPHAAVAAGPPAGGRHTLSSLPGKAKSMVDLAVTGEQQDGEGKASGSQPTLDLIRLDSEPLPDSLLHACAGEGGGAALPPPERSGTPTGPGPGVRGGTVVSNRRQNSFDQNGWVKFSGSFTRSKDDSKPWAQAHPHHGAPVGLSPLGQAAGERAGALAPAAAPQRGSLTASTAPPTPTGPVQSLELSTSFTSLLTAPSPDGTRPGSSVGSAGIGAAGASGLGAAGISSSASAPHVAPGGAGLTAASAFANFRLPSDLSAAAIGAGGAGGGGLAAVAAGSTGGSGCLNGRASHAGSEGNVPRTGGVAQLQHHSGPQYLSTQQPPQQPQQPLKQTPQQTPQQQPPQQPPRPFIAAASPFQAMQMGFAANMPSLASAFGVTPPQQPPAQQQQLHQQQQQHQQQPGAVSQQQQQLPRPSQAPTGGSGGATGGALGVGATPVPLPRMGSLQYAGQPQPPSPPQPSPLQSSQVRQFGAVSHDSAHRMYGLGNGAAAVAAGPTGGGTAAYYTPPPKPADAAGPGGNAGSKAPSPALSTPFTALTASSAQSTPPGSAPADSVVPFADLSPFNVGEVMPGSLSGRREDRPAAERVPQQQERERLPPEREREQQREREQRDWERDRERERERERQRNQDRSRAQAFFADLSPFNTSSGAVGAGSDARDATPGRRAPNQQQPIVEMPSSDNSRETTPRVSLTNVGEPPAAVASGPNSGGAEAMALDLSRMHLSGAAAGGSRPDASVGRLGAMQQHQQHQQQQMQMQQAFGAMAAMGHAAGAHMGQHQQQLPNHLVMSYYAAAAMQGNPYMYMQPQAAMAAAAAAAAGMMGPQGYMQGQPGAMGQGWRPAYDPAWASGWAAAAAAAAQHGQHPHHQQQQQQHPNQYMLHAAYMQEQQRQQQQQAMMAAAGMTGQHQGLQGGQGRLSMVASTTTTTVQLVDSGVGTVGPAPAPAGPVALPAGASRLSIASGGPQLALPPATAQPHTQPQPQLQRQQSPHQLQQQLSPPLPQQPSPPHQHPPPPQQQQQLHQQPQQPPVDLAHEMTIPSARRLERLQVGQDVGGPGAVGLSSPLGLQPSLSVSMPLPPSYRDLEILSDELTFKNRIGIGSYGEVYKGTWRGTDVAIKRFLEQNLSPVTIKEFRDEVMIMSKLRHPNIVLFMGAVTQSNQLAIVTQYVARGSLFRMLHRTKELLDPRRRLNMALDIAKGMEYLHNCKPVLVHRDLKSPNLLVDKDYTIKVCDFGLSQVKQNTFLTAKSQGGSPAWMAPEILRGEPCDEKSDVFSFGVILYELVTGKEPWEELSPMQVVGAVGFSGKRMKLPADLDPAVTALIETCWATSPKERPSFSQILATMNAWSELRPTAAVMQQQEAAAKARR